MTEFLPVSSSGHLVIFQALFGQDGPRLLFDVVLHVGSHVAIFVVFRESIAETARAAFGLAGFSKQAGRGDAWMPTAIIVGCVPTAVIGVCFAERFERLFASTTAAGVGLLVTGALLMSTQWGKASSKRDGGGLDRVGIAHALLIGVAQGLAITPGVSRSGATIAVALLLGIERELAARFSFILAIPAILGALVFELKDHFPAGGSGSGDVGATAMLLGGLAAAVTGIIALKLLLGIVRKGKLSLFAYYCWALGLLAIGYGVLRG